MSVDKTGKLNVWYNDRIVGAVYTNDNNNIGFTYNDKWQEKGFSISNQLPLTTKDYPPNKKVAHNFFTNLLPEAGARSRIINELKIHDNDYNLLKAIGGECAGALTILPDNEEYNNTYNYQAFSNDSFRNLLRTKGSLNTFTDLEKKPRLSLAGAQDKCAIYIQDQEYYIPEKYSPSSHIIKFEVTGLKHIPAYEYFLSKLAKTLSLPVVNCELKTFEDCTYLLVERYDRILDKNNKLQRLHQEDFCQALGYSHNKKNQMDDGPNFAMCSSLVKDISSEYLHDYENIIKWQIFNFLSGNSDAHAKNISFLYQDEKNIQLAPFYDLVCTRAIDRIDSKLAFSIGNEYIPTKISIEHFKKMAVNCKLSEKYLLKLVKDCAITLIDNFQKVQNDFENLHGEYPALQRVKQVVMKQCNKILSKSNS